MSTITLYLALSERNRMRVRSRVGFASVAVAGAVLLAPPAARADGIPFTSGTLGAPITYEGGDVLLKFLYKQADFRNQLFVFHTATGQTYSAANTVPVFSNEVAVGSEFSFNPHSALGLNAGDELIFGICTNVPTDSAFHVDCGAFGMANSIVYSGGAGRQVDGMAHARVEDHCSNVGICGAYTGQVVAFEDLRLGRSDRDYNDFVFSVQQSITTTPEPISMTLMGTGLVGMAGANLARRRKARRG